MNRILRWTVPIAALSVILAGCSSDSGDSDAAETSPPAETAAATDAAAVLAEVLDKAAEEYKAYVISNIDELQRVVKVFTDAVRAGDLQAAQDAYAPSRMPWERIEPIAGLVEQIDRKIDARVDDF